MPRVMNEKQPVSLLRHHLEFPEVRLPAFKARSLLRIWRISCCPAAVRTDAASNPRCSANSISAAHSSPDSRPGTENTRSEWRTHCGGAAACASPIPMFDMSSSFTPDRPSLVTPHRKLRDCAHPLMGDIQEPDGGMRNPYGTKASRAPRAPQASPGDAATTCS